MTIKISIINTCSYICCCIWNKTICRASMCLIAGHLCTLMWMYRCHFYPGYIKTLPGFIHAYMHMLCRTDRGLWPWGVHHLTFDPVFTNEEVCDYSVHNHSEPRAQALCKGVVCVKWSVYLLLWPQSGQVGLVPSSVWRGLEKQRAEAWVFGLGRRAGCLGDAEGKQ